MMRRWAFLLAIGGLALISESLQAQSYNYQWQGKAATVGESHARGMSDIIRSRGEANLRNSEAAINYEEARSRNFDNRLKYTRTYFEKKRINDEYRKASRSRPTSEQLFRIAKRKLPKRLTTKELDPLTGEIAWPAVLKQPTYGNSRKKVDAAFAHRAKNGVADFTTAMAAVSGFKAELKKNVRSTPPQLYGSAQSFLDRLNYELQF